MPMRVSAFLDYLEVERRNGPRTRNARLTAIRSLFIFASLRHPEHAGSIGQVLAIPPKRFDKAIVAYLDHDEAVTLLAAPDRSTWVGRRDYTLMAVAMQIGLRISELLGLDCGDIVLGTGAHVRCEGKGRKQRSVPLTEAVRSIVAAWLDERPGRPAAPVFITHTGRRPSADSVQRRITLHAENAAAQCSSLKGKHLRPHVLRHTSAMSLLHAGVDITVIALWLGHADVRSTNAYLHADLAIKERALAAQLNPAAAEPGRYRRPDRLLT